MKSSAAPILNRADLLSAIERSRSAGLTIALANGCFDLFHVGHLRYLIGAAQFADVLVVAVNSDAQSRKLKGEGRPYINEAERAEIVASVRVVDLVTVFDEATVEEILLAVKPEFHVKGTDYTVDTVPEREVVLSYGGRVAIAGDPKDHSSTELIGRIAER